MPDLSGTAPPVAGADARYTVAGYGYDDITLGFELTGSALSLQKIREMEGRDNGPSKILGYEASWGKFENLLGRSFSKFIWDTKRLYVQWKPAARNELLRPCEFEAQFRDLEKRLAVVGIETWEPVWVTRLDVSVDLLCDPEDGKALLDGLEAARLPRGQRITVDGQPRSTVYFRPRVSNDVLARAYCRNLRTRTGAPFGKIRLEAVQRFKPKEWWADYCFKGDVAAAMIWEARYGNEQVDGRVTRLSREVQVLTLTQRVRLGELTAAQFERMSGFLAERLGVAREIYSDRLYSERRREARELGLSVNDVGQEPIDVDLGELLKQARKVWAA
ncbi:MAG TPA: hypothetical protein VHC67_07210 [Gaiellaceae bacterium]|jgi:hypothetical protein|nr:hypothetical protein [Gaiellaceae bacterium]